MNKLSLTKLRKWKAGNIRRILPAEITVDGEPIFVIGEVDKIITLSDLHVRVQNQLKAREKQARMGMPKPEEVEPAELEEESSEEE